MEKVVNIVNLAGWTYLLVNIEIELIFNREAYVSSDITLVLWILRAVQLFQVSDILLVLIGKSKGNVVAAFFQILGRNVVTLFLMEPETNHLSFAGVLVIWSIADINRYLYYIFKNNSLTAFLRYNSFLLLYPIGGFAEMVVINNYISRHPELEDIYIYMIRAIQAMIITGVVVLYSHMLKARSKYMKSSKEEKKVEESTLESEAKKTE